MGGLEFRDGVETARLRLISVLMEGLLLRGPKSPLASIEVKVRV